MKRDRSTNIRLFFLGVFLFPLLVAAQEKDGEDAATPGWRFEFQRKYELFRDYGHDWRLAGMFGITPEDGVLLGAGAILYEFGFRTFPYVYRMQLTGGLTIPTGHYKLVYSLVMPALTDRLSLDVRAHASELEVTGFYGYGNNSSRDKGKERDDYYRVLSQQFKIHPILFHEISPLARFGLGADYTYFKIREKKNRIYNQFNLDSLGNNRSQFGVGLSLVVDARDYAPAPHRGFLIDLQGWEFVSPSHLPFQHIAGAASFYVGDTLLTDVMLAIRVGGEKMYGPFPFQSSAFLGGGSLRGFNAQRFAGDAFAYGNIDIRISLFRTKLIVPTEVGLIGLADAGRVWLQGDSPGGWHSDGGGGIWLAPLNRDALFSFLLASSVDGLFFRAGIGFGF